MRVTRYLTSLALVAGLAVASPASAVTTVKIVAADGTPLNYTHYQTLHLALSVWGSGWQCAGASVAAPKFLGGAPGATCVSSGSGTVYLSGGEWWIDYP